MSTDLINDQIGDERPRDGTHPNNAKVHVLFSECDLCDYNLSSKCNERDNHKNETKNIVLMTDNNYMPIFPQNIILKLHAEIKMLGPKST